MLPQMKTLTQLKQAMKAPMYRELTERELLIYKTGFKNGFRMSLQQNKAKIEGELFKLKLKQEHIESKKDKLPTERKAIPRNTFDAVVNKICIRYEVSKDALLGVRRYEFLVRSRSIMINLFLEVYGISLSELGRLLQIDHSTVIHHRRLKYMGERFWKSDKTIHEEFKDLKEQLEL
jgi:chromosomal replication initiation ATPase DnaA